MQLLINFMLAVFRRLDHFIINIVETNEDTFIGDESMLDAFKNVGRRVKKLKLEPCSAIEGLDVAMLNTVKLVIDTLDACIWSDFDPPSELTNVIGQFRFLTRLHLDLHTTETDEQFGPLLIALPELKTLGLSYTDLDFAQDDNEAPIHRKMDSLKLRECGGVTTSCLEHISRWCPGIKYFTFFRVHLQTNDYLSMDVPMPNLNLDLVTFREIYMAPDGVRCRNSCRVSTRL